MQNLARRFSVDFTFRRDSCFILKYRLHLYNLQFAFYILNYHCWLLLDKRRRIKANSSNFAILHHQKTNHKIKRNLQIRNYILLTDGLSEQSYFFPTHTPLC